MLKDKYLQANKSWKDMNLNENIMKGLVSMKLMKPSRIQISAIPLIIDSDKHLLAQSRNGSGKTISFLVGSISKIDIEQQCLQVLVVAPNRELMNQIYSVALELVKFMDGINVAKIIDVSDVKTLSAAHFIVSTPGIAVKSVKRGVLKLDNIKVVVFDEADVILGANDQDHCTQIVQFVTK
jgi:ATP-dependent RNA helicase DDX19/DBP5